ncbi:MAG TPA: hypothetical protein H9837_04730 [Candidatus Brachybacterium merdigallinarum]|jgi:chromate transport protein ChrA|nr:hypothetical protein [Candidatus Brachybacterium merdigallinarum]
MTGPARPERTEEDGEGRAPQVAPLTVPLLFLGMIVGFFAGYLLAWWGLIVLGALLMAAVSMVIRGGPRDAATALMLGSVGAYIVVILLAVFYGAF